MQRWKSGWTFVLALSLLSSPVLARRKAPHPPPVTRTLAVFPFTGKGAAVIRAQTFSQLSKVSWLELAPLAGTDAVLRATGSGSASETLRQLGVGYRMNGRVVGARARLVLTISAADGTLIAEMDVPLRRGAFALKAAALAVKLDRAFNAAPRPPLSEPTPPSPTPPVKPATEPPAPEPSPPIQEPPAPAEPVPTRNPVPIPEPSVAPPPQAVVVPPPPAPLPAPTPKTRQKSVVPAVVAEPPPSTIAPELAEQPEPRFTQHPLVELAVGGGAMRRTLSYTDDLFHVLSGYQASAVLSGEFGLGLFPFARVNSSAIRGIGLVGAAQAEPRIDSVDGSGKHYSTNSNRWQAGLQYRYPLGTSEVALSAFYGNQTFSVSPLGSALAGPIPGVSYTFVSPRLSGRLALGSRVFVLLSVAYLDVMGTGELGSNSRFPRLKVGAVEGDAGFAIHVWGPWEIRAHANYRRYYFSFNPRPGDPYIAGGAVDDYATILGGVAARWP